jgi:DNA-binding response OmpR family regulator
LAVGEQAGLVICIEDDKMHAELVKYFLEREGYQVEWHQDGASGMDRITADAPCPDLVVLDIMLPYNDGYTILQAIRKSSSWSHVPVLLLTSMSRSQDIERGFSLGADDYLTKPFRPTELIARLRRLLPATSSK